MKYHDQRDAIDRSRPKETPAGDPAQTETVDAQDRTRQTLRVLRGGAFSYAPDRAPSAWRDWRPARDDREYVGLRVVRTLPLESP
jgi:formylglycine-generating enzyme required for sulfatase activity